MQVIVLGIGMPLGYRLGSAPWTTQVHVAHCRFNGTFQFLLREIK